MKILNKIIFWSYAAAVFFVPLIFAPWNYELFQFNKMVLIYFLTTLILCTWIAKMICQKEIIFQKTFWDLPLILFLLSQIAATIFSIDPHTSIFGYYSRFNGGLLSTICYLILYWGLVSNLTKQKAKKLINIGLAGGILVALYGIAQHFGVDKDYWVQDVQRRVFSTLGQPNWLATYLNILIFLILTVGTSRDLSLPNVFLFSIYYICLLFTKSRSGSLGFIFPFATWLIYNVGTSRDLSLQSKKLRKIGLITLITIVLSLTIGIPFSVKDKLSISFMSDNFIQENSLPTNTQHQAPLITPSSDIRKIVWQGAVKLWQQNPILGTGTETFGYSYYWVRPKEHNLTSEWNFLYNKAHNEYLNYAATTGILGLISYIVLPISFFIYIFKNKKSLFAISYSLLSILITNFFGFSTVTTSLFFFLIPGIAFLQTTNVTEKRYELRNPNRLTGVLIFLITIVSLFLISCIARYWLADFHYAKGEKYADANMLNTAEKHLKKAIKLNPFEPNFYSELGIIHAKLTAYYTQNDQFQEAEKYLKPAINNSLKALEISPYHLNFYKNHTQVYYYLAIYNLDLLKEGIETLKKAEELAPTDPKIPFNLAQMHQTLDNDQKAKKYYQKALDLKPNYTKAKAALEKLSL